MIVGAGAAGLAAARSAGAQGVSLLVLEAKRRIGGRAHTDTETFGVPWDRGAHWLHSAGTNPFVRFADQQGLAYERSPAPIRLWRGDGFADPALHADVRSYYARAYEAVGDAGARGLDIAAAEVVPPHERYRAMFESWFAALAGVEPERMSTLDYWRYEEVGGNYRVEMGYGALLQRWGTGIPVELATAARRIRWGGEGVTIETARGDLRARAVIVTVSTSALTAGRIRFDPPLPAAAQDAFAGVPLGEANKVALAFERDAFDLTEPGHVHFEHGTLEAIRFEIRPFGRNLAIGYLGGRFARELEARGPDAMADFALERLVAVLGSGIRRHLKGVASTAWCGDPDIRGGYSCALPGQAHLRPVLSEPVAERIFFAGEACALDAYGTVHGAAKSGAAAAETACKVLAGGRGPLQRAPHLVPNTSSGEPL